ncbi:retrovirus-related pol polyprotein from transposon TNT 1-94 [Tanacetum coccineum]|uniref:Retrovirus-related pol polyprotein from transposon TNT 1-94 n=1 Tax=Tanacetum coccineum TaxID=301880 RepID=A0ABQ5CIT1_9ASTR
MDLCGPMRVESINGKKYILVIVDDYSRFTWVKFLRSKDEAHDVIIKCLKQIQVRLNATVRNVRTDNGTEFVNQTLKDYYENTPYELMHEKKPDLSFLHVFGSLCYLTNDSEDLGKLKLKADIVPTAVAPRPVDPTGSPVSTSVDQDAPYTKSPKTPHFHDDPLHETLHEDSTSQELSSNMRSSHTPLELLGKWTKNHPLENVIGDPSRSVSTRKQLKTDVMWCYFDAFLTSIEPKNFKEAMLESSWIEAMQEEIHEFERLQV